MGRSSENEPPNSWRKRVAPMTQILAKADERIFIGRGELEKYMGHFYGNGDFGGGSRGDRLCAVVASR